MYVKTMRHWMSGRAVALGVVIGSMAISAGPGAAAEKRVALVIGNAAYANAQHLANPARDATAMQNALEQLGFEVVSRYDLTGEAMRAELKDFSTRAAGADYALIYFAGHGVAVDKKNYLIPVDAQLLHPSGVEEEAIPLDAVMAKTRQARKLRLVILDACRNNPFRMTQVPGDTRDVSRGLAVVEPNGGELVVFSARDGSTALDGSGANSPFTGSLITRLTEPGTEIGLLFRKVRDDVIKATGGKQEPFTYGSLPADSIVIAQSSRDLTVERESGGAPSGAGSGGDRMAEAAQVWQTLKDTTSEAQLAQFLEDYGGTPFARYANARLNELRNGAKAKAPAASPVEAAAPAPAAPAATGGTASRQPAGGGSMFAMESADATPQRLLFGSKEGFYGGEVIAFSPKGSTALAGTRATFLDTNTGREIRQFKKERASNAAAVLSPDGSKVFTIEESSLGQTHSSTATLWETATGRQIGSVASHAQSIRRVAVSPNRRFVLSHDREDVVKLWDTTTGALLKSVTMKSGAMSKFAIASDGRTVASSDNSKLSLWDITTGQEFKSFSTPLFVTAMAFSPDGRNFIVADSDKKCTLWDAQTGAPLKTFAGHTSRINVVAFSPDGQYILTGGSDGLAKLWDAKSGRELFTFKSGPSDGSTDVDAAAFAPDGRSAMTLATGKGLRIAKWDLRGLVTLAAEAHGAQ